MTKIEILGIQVDNLTETEVVEAVRQKIRHKEKFWIATPNPEMIVKGQKEPSFARILNSADLAVPDGAGLIWAGRILGQALSERVTGTDLMAKLCKVAAQEKWRVALLGGRNGVASEALEALKKHYPGLEGIALPGPLRMGVKDGKLEVEDEKENQEAIAKINHFQPDLLFVGFGMGKQERWVVQHLKDLKIGGALVVGGAFDYYSGRIRRAPLWIRKICFEWFWRLWGEPWRWKRQRKLLTFAWLVIKERFRS